MRGAAHVGVWGGGRRRGAAALLALALTLGCTEHKFEPPDRDAQVAEADVAFSMALFDTIAWDDPDARALEGNVVYATYCRNCHGQMGAGDTEYARSRDLAVPSLVTEEWRWADRPDSVLYRIYVGHAQGMPTWGVAGISLREMDAVTGYLMEVLRPEIAGGGS